MLMVHIKKYYENTTNEEIVTERYNALEISPVHIHKDKKAHKEALLTLGDEIVSHINGHHVHVVNYSPETATAQVAVEH
ncbi:MAG: UPF0058 family protein [Methanoregula sp.]|nr:UPF0058 family protein [Methanoregula sp.]